MFGSVGPHSGDTGERQQRALVESITLMAPCATLRDFWTSKVGDVHSRFVQALS